MIFSFKDAEAVFATRYGVASSGAVAFRGRLQHLQRGGFPEGVNTGKGRKAEYGWPQLIQLSAALDLIDLGVSPDFAGTLVGAHREHLIIGAAGIIIGWPAKAFSRAVDDQRCPFDRSMFLFTVTHALYALGDDRLGRQLLLVPGHQLVTMIREPSPGLLSGAYVDLGTRILEMISFISFCGKINVSDVIADYRRWATDVVDRSIMTVASEVDHVVRS